MPWEFSTDGTNHFFDEGRPLPLCSRSIRRLTSSPLDGKPDCSDCRAAESVRRVAVSASAVRRV